MDKPQKRPRSLRDFDYFADQPVIDPSDEMDAGSPHAVDPAGWRAGPPGSARPSGQPRVPPRRIVSLVLTALVLGFAVWFAWQFRDYAQYAFSPADAPLRLGNVSEITPEMVPHNAYVSVHGITEHRGLHAKSVRGLTLHHEEYWYFRLMGSRGIFIEVVPDAETYGPNTEVTVQGRSLDPDADPLYTALLKSYEDTFVTELRAHRRIIQVGLKPGDGRNRYGVALALLAACLGVFTINGGRLIRDIVHDRRERPQKGEKKPF